MTKLKWFVKLDKVFPESEPMWSVFKGGFRDSSHATRWSAEIRCEQLNKIDRTEECVNNDDSE